MGFFSAISAVSAVSLPIGKSPCYLDLIMGASLSDSCAIIGSKSVQTLVNNDCEVAMLLADLLSVIPVGVE